MVEARRPATVSPPPHPLGRSSLCALHPTLQGRYFLDRTLRAKDRCPSVTRAASSWQRPPSQPSASACGHADGRNVALPRLLGWLIILPERMRARRAPSGGKAGAPTKVAAHGAVVASLNAGPRIATRHVNPTAPAAFGLNSAKTSTVLLCCCGAGVCKGYNREKADSRQITHRICPLCSPNGKAPSPCVDKPGAPTASPPRWASSQTGR